MQQELTDLQPELIKTSEETEKLMVKIEQDTVEVEAKKEVSWTCAAAASVLGVGCGDGVFCCCWCWCWLFCVCGDLFIFVVDFAQASESKI